jgi:DNA-binding transcriptional ArsR family regulator
MTDGKGGQATDRQRIAGAPGMRAMAHPARLAALQHLMLSGPATATELGEVVGLTPSAMSYHLRSLEKVGMITTAPSRGDGRERVWQSSKSGWQVDSIEDGTEEMRLASLELIEAVVALQDIDTRQWMAQADAPGWLDRGVFLDMTLIATEEELEKLGDQISELLLPLSGRTRQLDGAPEGAVPIRAIFRGFPRVDRAPGKKDNRLPPG